MERLTSVLIHESRYPGRVRDAYLESFRARRMNHQFHYDTQKQAQLWLAIHEAYSPARRDDDCLGTYTRAFLDVGRLLIERPMSLISLGCGGGQKDISLLDAMGGAGQIVYVPTDVSLALSLTAHSAARSRFPNVVSKPAVFDLSKNLNLAEIAFRNGPQLWALFGMLPNFEPEEILPQISMTVGKRDYLLASANLAPGAEIQKIMPQYDNDPTRRWLAAVLLDAGIEMDPLDIEFTVETVKGIGRIMAGYRFKEDQSIRLDGEEFVFKNGDWFQLFFSYRHTPSSIREVMGRFEMEVKREWITASGEEGIFLLAKCQAESNEDKKPAEGAL